MHSDKASLPQSIHVERKRGLDRYRKFQKKGRKKKLLVDYFDLGFSVGKYVEERRYTRQGIEIRTPRISEETYPLYIGSVLVVSDTEGGR